ncbi:MAG: HU family DNA-binding protein [Candidatus Rokuibacteriota bacterium]
MAKMMTKSTVVSTLAEKCSLTKKQVAGFMEEFQALAVKEAKKNGFIVPGFGKLVLSNRKARMGRNPQTGEPIKIPAKRVVRFRVAKAMKDAILGGKK